MDGVAEGFATGGKDSSLKLWDKDFKPIAKVDLSQTQEGYKGVKLNLLFVYLITFHIFFIC